MERTEALEKAMRDAVARLREAADATESLCPDPPGYVGTADDNHAHLTTLIAYHAALADPLREIAADLDHALRDGRGEGAERG